MFSMLSLGVHTSTISLLVSTRQLSLSCICFDAEDRSSRLTAFSVNDSEHVVMVTQGKQLSVLGQKILIMFLKPAV